MAEQTHDTSDFSSHADRVAEQNRQFLQLDYTPASIAALGCFIDETWGESGESPETEEWHQSDQKWNTILNFGIYFGEFLIRRYGGAWVRYEPQPDSLLNIGVVFPNGVKVFPVAKVWKRFKNGVEDSIDPLYRWIRSQLNDEPSAEEWREWLNHGNWFMRVNRPDRAIPFFRRGLACPLTDSYKGALETALKKAHESEKAAASENEAPVAPEPSVPSLQEASSAPSTRNNLQARCAAEVRRLVSGGNRDSALALLQKALARLPEDSELNELLGDQLSYRKDISGAMVAYEKGTKRWESARSWEGLGICRNLTGDTEGAIAAWQEAANRNTKIASPCYRLALAEEQRDNKMKALEWYRLTAERVPADEKLRAQVQKRIHELESDPDQIRQQANRFADQGDTTAAVTVYEKLAAINPRDTEAWREAGVGYAMLKQFEKALECLDHALKVNPHDHLAWDYKAVTQARMGKFALGLDTVDQGLVYCLDAAQLWHRRSFLLGKLNRYQEAIVAANKALELDPENGTPYLFRFDAERQQGKTAEALESISRHIAWIHPRDHRKGIESMKLKWELENPGRQLDPQQAAEFQEYAFQYWQNGNIDQSLAAYRKAVELDPFSYEIWNNYGSSLSGIGKHEDAIACFDRAHELYPLITDFLANKAVALSRLSRNDEALACHEQILQKYAKFEKSLDERSRLLGVLERWEESLSAAEAFAEQYPNRPEPFVRASWALKKLGRAEDALVAIERAINAAPSDRKLWLNKYTILDELGFEDEALELITKAFEDKEFAEQYHQEGLQMLKQLGI